MYRDIDGFISTHLLLHWHTCFCSAPLWHVTDVEACAVLKPLHLTPNENGRCMNMWFSEIKITVCNKTKPEAWLFFFDSSAAPSFPSWATRGPQLTSRPPFIIMWWKPCSHQENLIQMPFITCYGSHLVRYLRNARAGFSLTDGQLILLVLVGERHTLRQWKASELWPFCSFPLFTKFN